MPEPKKPESNGFDAFDWSSPVARDEPELDLKWSDDEDEDEEEEDEKEEEKPAEAAQGSNGADAEQPTNTSIRFDNHCWDWSWYPGQIAVYTKLS